jgi:hypothetical protein
VGGYELFGHKAEQRPGVDEEIPVDATLEIDIRDVEQAVDEYLQNPTESSRKALLKALEQLDDQTASADAYSGQFRVTSRYGLDGGSLVLGATSSHPITEDVESDELRAQVELVKAAKAAVTNQTPKTLEALRSSAVAISGVRAQEVTKDSTAN